jgi:HlyD family secretion protein
MTAYISIPVAEAKNVVKIPNGALRFKPDLTDSERTALYAKYGVQDSARATPAGRIAAAPGDAAAASNSGGAAATGGQSGQAGPGGGGRGGQGGSGAGGNSKRQDSAIIWKLLPDKTLQPVQVTLGVTDFTFTALVSGSLNPGDDLVIGQSTNKSSASQAQVRNPVTGAGGGAPGVPRRF